MAQKKAADKAIVQLTGLDDLRPFDVIVEIDLPTGEVGQMRMKTLTYAEWLRLGAEIADAVPPQSGFDAKKMQPTYDWTDATYQRAQAEVQMRRSYRRLLAALPFGDQIAGATVAEQIDTLVEAVDFGVAQKLFTALNLTGIEGEARVVGRAATFLGDGPARPPRLPGAEQDGGRILEPAAGSD